MPPLIQLLQPRVLLKERNAEEQLILVHEILELAQAAHSLCLTRKLAEQVM